MEKLMTKYMAREYRINYELKKLGGVFYNFFKEVVDFNFLAKSKLWKPIDFNTEYSYETFIVWANQLRELNVIDDQIYNAFMEFLEVNSPTMADPFEQKEESNQEIHFNTTDDQGCIYKLADNHIELLKLALANCIDAEKECFNVYIKNNPTEEPVNCLWRIRNVLKPILEEIERCEPIDSKKASKMPKPKIKPKPISPIEPLKQIKSFKE